MMHKPMAPNFDEVFIKELEAQYESIATYVDKGNCKDFGEYKLMAGQMVGLKSTINSFKELVSRFQKE